MLTQPLTTTLHCAMGHPAPTLKFLDFAMFLNEVLTDFKLYLVKLYGIVLC